MMRIIEIPKQARDIHIVRSKSNWYLKYNTTKTKTEKIVIAKPCDIEMLCRNNNKLYAVVNTYTPKEYKNL